MQIASAGSCFAQHIGKRMAQSGFRYMDVEPAPALLPKELHQDYGYSLYSARYGNIYTAKQLLQLFRRAYGTFVPIENHWEKDGRFYDPFRPAIEAGGFESLEELEASRRDHFAKVRQMFETVDVFIFTLGLTEYWRHKEDKAAYPVCPGTAAGKFDPDKYEFCNAGFVGVRKDMLEFISELQKVNPTARLILTVSPVPLTATNSGQHVLVATTMSKAILRSVAGTIANNNSQVDYFPSFEIINSHPSCGRFYDENMRTVTSDGVDFVMHNFLSEHTPPGPVEVVPEIDDEEDDIVCEEELLDEGGGQ